MVEVTVYLAPDLSAGGEKGEVGYATMQHSTHSHPNSIPTLPTHSSCRPPYIISCCPLEPARCIMSHMYLGNYLISLDDDFDKAILSICKYALWPGVSCFSSTGFINVSSFSQIYTIVNARPKLRIHLEEEVSHQASEGPFRIRCRGNKREEN